ncbi:hypothetical protein [Fictibacillus enclensis]|uniref:hypothetical protein n=1 Tax=Fictibacillus enclensis TaxID=1017270 RepID=UPI0024BFED4F|nr:hypothetical protein [Fictibacillus enclensis]WHY71784.1 hypothetical protein QNH15_22750 [Fictibacillus enclensis]
MSRRFLVLLVTVAVCYVALYLFLDYAHSSYRESKVVMVFQNHDYWSDVSYRQKVFIKSDLPTEWTLSVSEGKSRTYVETEKNQEFLRDFEMSLNEAASEERQAFTWGATTLLISFCFWLYRKEWIPPNDKHPKQWLFLVGVLVFYFGIFVFQHVQPALYAKEDAEDAYYDLRVGFRQ